MGRQQLSLSLVRTADCRIIEGGARRWQRTRYGGVSLFMIVVSLRRGGIQYAFYFDVACDLRANRGLGGGEWELRRKMAETEMPSA